MRNGFDENASLLVRLSQDWTGSHHGAMAIPRIGHEVVVTFLEGDPDRPLITDRVFNAANPVPYPLPEHKTRTVFKSMSTPGAEGEPRGFNEMRVEDRKGQEEIYVHAEKDVNVYVKNDWKEHILHDQHRTIDNFSYSLVKGEDQQTVHLDRKVELLADDHLTVRGSSHSRIGDKWLVAAGRESHVAAGRKIVVEAGSELTIKAGRGFIKIDPSGVYVGGAKVKINSGGSPRKGAGAKPLMPKGSRNVDRGAVPQALASTVQKSTQTPDQIAKSVNPTNSTINCGYIVDAVIARLYKINSEAVSPKSLDGTFTEIGDRHGTEIKWGYDINDAFNSVQKAGHGSTAIVGIDYGNGCSHVIVITNDNGTPTIIEGQNWGSGIGAEAITSPSVAQQRYKPADVGIGILPNLAR